MLSRIEETKKLTKQDLDAIVETLKIADPETPEIPFIGTPSAPAKIDSAQVSKYKALKSVS